MKFRKLLAGVLSAGVLMSATPFSISAAEPSTLPNPVLKVTFDDATASDTSGRGNNGTIIGSPEFVEGVKGRAIHLVNPESIAGESPTAEQCVDFGAKADLKFGEDDFSIGFWYKASGDEQKEGAVVSNKDWGSGGNPGFNVGDMKQGLNVNFNTNGFSGRAETDRFGSATDGQWHYVTAVFDRSDKLALYIDGAPAEGGAGYQSKSYTATISDRTGSIDVANFVLGADGNKKYSVQDAYIDELVVFQSALTTDQIAELAKKEEKPAPVPVLQVSFDDETAKDSSGKGHDGTIVGTPEFVEGMKGKAIRLVNSDGVAAEYATAEQYVDFGIPDDLKFGTEDFSIMFWYKSNGDDPEEVAVLGNKDWNYGSNPGFVIGDMRNGMTLNFNTEGSSRTDTSRITAATDNTWRHITATFNRTGSMTLYVDGQNVASANISAHAGKTIDVANFVLGADGLKNFGVKDSSIDELAVYRTALSPEFISDVNAPYVLQRKIAEYEKLVQESTASKEKTDAFKKAIEEVKKAAQGVTDVAVIRELTEQLRKAFNAFSGPEKGLIEFDVVSDVHISGEDMNSQPSKYWIDALTDIKEFFPDSAAVLNCGDFADSGNENQFKGYFDIVDQYGQGMNILTALGNHDVRWKSGWDEVYERYMRYNSKHMGETNGKVYFDKWIEGYHFVVLNTEWDIKDRAYISPEQLAWLDATMAEDAQDGKPIFVVLHQAMRDTYAISNDWSVGVQDYALKEVLRKYPQTVMFTGHLHDGLGAMEIVETDYGTIVDVPGLRSNDQGDSRGQLGFHVTVYDDTVQLSLRDFKNDEWMPDYNYTINMDPASRPKGKVLDVSFDDETAKDSSGHGNDGTIVGNPEFVEGVNGGKAIRLVNSDSVFGQAVKAEQYVNFGDKESLKFGQEDFSILFWYKGTTEKEGDGAIISNKNWNSGSNPGFAIGAFHNAPGVALNFNTEGNSRADTSRYSAATDGNWHHIAATFDRSGSMTIYIDGQAAGSKDISGQSGKSIDVEGLGLVLGADGNLQNSASDICIDELKVYHKVLGAAELETVCNPYSIEVGETQVTISWPLPSDDSVEPAYLALNGKKVADIASGETSKTITGLAPGTQYTVLLVNREKAHTGNYRDVYPFVFTTEGVAVNKTALQALYNANKNKTQDDYTSASWLAFQNALKKAKAVLDDNAALQKDVDDAVAALQAAVDGLVLKADRTVLNEAIAAAEKLSASDYTAESWSALQAAVTAGKNLPEEATAEQIAAAAKAITDAIAALEKAPAPPVDRTALDEAIAAAAKLTAGDYTTESWAALQAALDAGKKLGGDATAEQVAAAAKAITDAIAALEKAPAPPVDRTALDEVIAAAEKLNASDYTTESWSKLQAAVAAGKALADDATAEQVAAAAKAITDAIAALVEVTTPPVDRSVLDDAIAAAEKLTESDYTAESWAALQEAVAAGKALGGDAAAEQIAAAAKAINDAIANLKKNEPIDTEKTIVDEETGVAITGKLPDNAELKVELITDGANLELAQNALTGIEGSFVLWDIQYLVNGAVIQPDGTITLSLPIPEGYDPAKVELYRIEEDGTKTLIESTVKDGKLVATLDHLSLYALVHNEAKGNNSSSSSSGSEGSSSGSNSSSGTNGGGTTPSTGDAPILPLVVLLAGSGAAALVLKRRKHS